MSNSEADSKSVDSGFAGVVKTAGNYFAILAFMGFLLVFFLEPFVRQPRSRPRPPCKRNLHSILIALHNYHHFHDSFPPAFVADAEGRPLYSWRVLILPYIDQKPLYDQLRLDEPWDSPHNRPLLDVDLSLYSCPGDREHEARASETSFKGMTSYVAVVGPETVWPAPDSCQFEEIADGTGRTVAVVEVANSGIHWAEPRDLVFSEIPYQVNPSARIGLSSLHQGGAHVCFCDGSVRFIANETLPSTIRALLTRAGGEDVGDDF